MFRKVLVAEDMDDINKGVVAFLKELGIKEIQHVQYCDDALLKLKRADLDKDPFDLLISDLSYDSDFRDQKINSGEDLAEVAKSHFPELKVIMYSVEDRIQVVRRLFKNELIKAYVCKGRNGLRDLSSALSRVSNDGIFLSDQVRHALKSNHHFEIDDFDIILLDQLSKGLSQDQISDYLKKNKIKPASLSSIEKRLNKLKVEFKANNAIHLIAKTKDMGLI
ncbi:response regulator [Lutimonas zeaxanthinifaciens]|uniref:response regulator n=1 Tax=Lutimonas zeaxanthinifaciens TaxID=3060215 RepID=UPI00265CA7FD|nr:response regulator [Lutimonas sp. YSD2104]WKK67481.1 response regulator [Lutimonas sp. YSD2104]